MYLSALAYIMQQLLPTNFGLDSGIYHLELGYFAGYHSEGNEKSVSVIRLNKGKKCLSHAQL